MKVWQLIQELKKVRWNAEVLTEAGAVVEVRKGPVHQVQTEDGNVQTYADAVLVAGEESERT